MKVPKHVKVIGHVQTISYRPPKFRNDKDLSFWSTDFVVAVNDSKTTLFFFPKGDPKPTKRGTKKAMEYKIPTTSLKRIGEATQIVWFWEEIEETVWHRFEFGRLPALYGDRYNNPRVLAMKYARGKILSERGIV